MDLKKFFVVEINAFSVNYGSVYLLMVNFFLRELYILNIENFIFIWRWNPLLKKGR